MEIRKAFNKHFSEFVDDIANYFSDNMEIQTAANALRTIRKANPKIIITVWKSSILDVYESKIEAGDIDFFVTKQYNDDVAGMEENDNVLEVIDKIRGPIKNMPEIEQQKAMKYIQNLTKLCKVYYLNRN